jgi:hypothetical protein
MEHRENTWLLPLCVQVKHIVMLTTRDPDLRVAL